MVGRTQTTTPKRQTTPMEDAMTLTSAAGGREQAADKNAIRLFHVNVPEGELTELRRRINATKWPERERSRISRRACSSRRFRNLRHGIELRLDLAPVVVRRPIAREID